MINNNFNDIKTKKVKNTNNSIEFKNTLSHSTSPITTNNTITPTNLDNFIKDNNNSMSQITNDELFANFDAFTTISTTSSSNYINKTQQNISNDLFDAFNDNFEKATSKEKDIFDAFGDSSINNSNNSTNKINNFSSDFDAFNDNFADKFSKLEVVASPSLTVPSKNANSSYIKTSSSITNDVNFAKFDFTPSSNSSNSKFDHHTPSNNNKSSNLNINRNNLKDDNSGRFSKDYSKGEDFESDLEAVIKRSMVEQ